MLVIQVLSCYDVRLVVRRRVAHWIHLFGVRFIYIDELLAGLTFPIFRLRVSLTWLGDSYEIHFIRRCIVKRSGQTVFITFRLPIRVVLGKTLDLGLPGSDDGDAFYHSPS
jgi:hypothetical protein